MNITLYGVIYSVRYYPRFSVTAVGLGTYYPRIRRSTCIYYAAHERDLGLSAVLQMFAVVHTWIKTWQLLSISFPIHYTLIRSRSLWSSYLNAVLSALRTDRYIKVEFFNERTYGRHCTKCQTGHYNHLKTLSKQNARDCQLGSASWHVQWSRRVTSSRVFPSTQAISEYLTGATCFIIAIPTRWFSR